MTIWKNHNSLADVLRCCNSISTTSCSFLLMLSVVWNTLLHQSAQTKLCCFPCTPLFRWCSLLQSFPFSLQKIITKYFHMFPKITFLCNMDFLLFCFGSGVCETHFAPNMFIFWTQETYGENYEDFPRVLCFSYGEIWNGLVSLHPMIKYIYFLAVYSQIFKHSALSWSSESASFRYGPLVILIQMIALASYQVLLKPVNHPFIPVVVCVGRETARTCNAVKTRAGTQLLYGLWRDIQLVGWTRWGGKTCNCLGFFFYLKEWGRG